MHLARASWLAALVFATSAACADPPTEANAAKQAEQAEPEPKPEKPADPNALTPEEQALIDSKVEDLTPEQRRKRAYALRKKIMQNPNSEAAKALEEARKAAEAGQINLGTQAGQPDKPADNGLVIPAPEYLKNQDQSYGKPAQ